MAVDTKRQTEPNSIPTPFHYCPVEVLGARRIRDPERHNEVSIADLKPWALSHSPGRNRNRGYLPWWWTRLSHGVWYTERSKISKAEHHTSSHKFALMMNASLVWNLQTERPSTRKSHPVSSLSVGTSYRNNPMTTPTINADHVRCWGGVYLEEVRAGQSPSRILIKTGRYVPMSQWQCRKIDLLEKILTLLVNIEISKRWALLWIRVVCCICIWSYCSRPRHIFH